MIRTTPLLLLLALVATGCLPATRSTTTAPHSPANRADARATIDRSLSDPALDDERRAVVREAAGWLGTPYRYAGTSRAGVDCSGLVQNVFGSVDRKLPRNSAEQAGRGEPVDLSEAMAGDLVFFNTTGSGVSHVGILVSREEFIHSSTSAGVIVSRLDETYYRTRILFVRRLLP
jgi:cell wall-associated NlpC family hydrolase